MPASEAGICPVTEIGSAAGDTIAGVADCVMANTFCPVASAD
jgi:hypothetical protein